MPGNHTSELLPDAVAATGGEPDRAGPPQGRISTYLSDRHHLPTPQLHQLLEPLGSAVRLALVPTGRRRDVTRRWLLSRAMADKLGTAPPQGWRERAGENLRRSRACMHARWPQNGWTGGSA